MNTTYQLMHSLEELDYRENDGVSVSLLWNRTTNELRVDVLDRKTAEAFILAVAAGEALDVFKHPYAYAAARGLLGQSVVVGGDESRSSRCRMA